MNLLAPISSIMTKDLVTVTPSDPLTRIKEIFDEKNIHHIPVVRFKKIVGIISKSDFSYFLWGYTNNEMTESLTNNRLKTWQAEDIMSTKLAKVESSDAIRTALEVFKINRFHAIPVVDNDELVGIITPLDIVISLANEPISLEDYKK
jgi:acetoin utilization protein AcuB